MEVKPLKTLDRAISKAGVGSRTEARSWIGAGRVSVNGRIVQTPDHWVDLVRDKIAIDGKRIQEQRKIYLLLYKPKGYLTTYKDPEGRPTVYEVGGREYVVFCVGGGRGLFAPRGAGIKEDPAPAQYIALALPKK